MHFINNNILNSILENLHQKCQIQNAIIKEQFVIHTFNYLPLTTFNQNSFCIVLPNYQYFSFYCHINPH